MWVGGCARICASVHSSVHVCRCALGLYHYRDNKLSRVICKLSRENFPAEALITFLLQLIVPKNTKSQSQLWRKAQTWSETITDSVGLCFFITNTHGIHLSVTANAPCLFNSACLFHSNQTRCMHKSRSLKVRKLNEAAANL